MLSSVTASRWLIPPINNRMGFLWRYQHRRSVAQCLQRSNTNQGNTMYIHLYIYTSIHTHTLHKVSLLYELMYFFPTSTVGESWDALKGLNLQRFFHVSVVKIKQKHILIIMCSLTYREAEFRFANYQRPKNVRFTTRFCTRIQHCKFGQNYQIISNPTRIADAFVKSPCST